MPKVSDITEQSYVDLAVMIGANIRTLTPEAVAHYLSPGHRAEIPDALRRGFVVPKMGKVGRAKASTIKVPNLSSTGQTFRDWIKAREKLHRFLTGETVNLLDMFDVPRELLARTNIMPVFRPAAVTNRMAIDWKIRLGMPEPYEETDVMKYENSEGPEVPTLGFVSRLVRPHNSTLGVHAKSSTDLLKVKMDKNQKWLNLYGWSDADNLHFLITRQHLDPETWNWSPEDQLPDGGVAHCSSRGDRSQFAWDYEDYCDSRIGARLATFFSLKQKS
jgi:hypothetical protein